MRETVQRVELVNTTDSEFRQSGLTGWLIRMWNSRMAARRGSVKKLQLVETLHMGSKKQLMLVQCGNEQFLVGGGMESITAIVRISSSEAEPCV